MSRSKPQHDWTVSSLLAQNMRAARKDGFSEAYDALCQYIYFDVTPIAHMAEAVRKSHATSNDGASGDLLVPDDLFLPAPVTWLEWYDDEAGQRRALSCGEMHDGAISISHVGPNGRSGRVIIEPGSSVMTKHPGISEDKAWWIATLAIELLAIMNQPNLCEFEPGCAGWQRSAAKGWVFGTVPTQWRRCTIRPGRHGKGSELGKVGIMPLHFVRKYRMPKLEAKLGRMVVVASRWRGDLVNGLILKEYLTSEQLAWARSKQLELQPYGPS